MRLLCILTLSALAGPLTAHPHTSVDQQVHIAIGAERARVSLRIVPSGSDGDVTREVLDLDRNGVVDDAEAQVFQNVVLGALAVTWNGAEVMPTAPAIRLAPLDTLAQALGQIEITADIQVSAPMNFVQVEMMYDGLGSDWFIQPFFFQDEFAGALPRIQRFEDSNRIELRTVDQQARSVQ